MAEFCDRITAVRLAEDRTFAAYPVAYMTPHNALDEITERRGYLPRVDVHKMGEDLAFDAYLERCAEADKENERLVEQRRWLFRVYETEKRVPYRRPLPMSKATTD